MPEVVDAVVVDGPPKPEGIEALIKQGDKPILQALVGADSLNWRDLKPPQLALLITMKPIPVSGGGVMYLSLRQAIQFAYRCYELGVSPFSGEAWFDPAKGTTNLTLEGKRQVARNKGIDLGPPQFVEKTRAWTDIPLLSDAGKAAKAAGFPQDLGYTCRIRVGNPEYQECAEYTAWLSEWYQPKSPVWQQKPAHMLQIRATEKTVSLALGTGISSMPDERELGDPK